MRTGFSHRLSAALVVGLLATACMQPPIQDDLTIEFSQESDAVTVRADTWFDLQGNDRATDARLVAAREAVIAGTDAWSARFARIRAESDSVMYQRNRGTLERASRTAVIAPEDLQTLLADSNITVNVLRGDGWRELTFYPGASSRASREQQRRIDDELATWSAAVARYLAAVHRMYTYLDERPARSEVLFAALLQEKGVDGVVPAVTESEQAFIEAVAIEMETIANRLYEREGRAATLHEELDLVFNPFPARITVLVPGEVVARVGFARGDDRSGVIERVELFEVIAALEGRWVAPDPVAALLQEQSPRAQEMAAVPRKSTAVVTAREVSEVLRGTLERRGPYRLRWRDD
ncbi:MAG TPA: hypothetical protein VF701_03890 [Thermoanaerobaculia bacterium]